MHSLCLTVRAFEIRDSSCFSIADVLHRYAISANYGTHAPALYGALCVYLHDVSPFVCFDCVIIHE